MSHGAGQDVTEFILPIAAMFLAFIKNLKPEDVVLEVLSQLLPSHFVPDLLEVVRDGAFVVGIEVAFQVLTLAFDDDHTVFGALACATLNDEVRSNLAHVSNLFSSSSKFLLAYSPSSRI